MKNKAKGNLFKKLALTSVSLAGLVFGTLGISGCGGGTGDRVYFGANDPVLNQEQNKAVIEKEFEDIKRTKTSEVYPLTFITYKS